MVVFIQNKVGQWRPSAWEHVNRVLQLGYRCTFYNMRRRHIGCIFSLLWAFKCWNWDSCHLLTKHSFAAGRQGEGVFCLSISNVICIRIHQCHNRRTLELWILAMVMCEDGNEWRVSRLGGGDHLRNPFMITTMGRRGRGQRGQLTECWPHLYLRKME